MKPLIVVKLGGSLFDLSDLRERLRSFFAAHSSARLVLLAGGGAAADLIRAADHRFALGEETSHALCVAQLDVSAALLAALLPEAELVDRCEAAAFQTAVSILAPRRWLEQVPADELPRTWNVTTDSIAALAAIRLAAEELILLKSADAPSNDINTWSACGYVDREFPRFAANIARVRCVNLRRASEV